MSAALSLSLKEARRLVLAAQGFTSRRPTAAIRAAHLLKVIERLGVVQIDSVNALVRSHYLPLFSRLGMYPRKLLDQAAWGTGRQRAFQPTGTKSGLCRAWSEPSTKKARSPPSM